MAKYYDDDEYDEEDYEDAEYIDDEDDEEANKKKMRIILGVVFLFLMIGYAIFATMNNAADNNTPAPTPTTVTSQQPDGNNVQPTAQTTEGANSTGSPIDNQVGDSGDESNMQFPITQKEMNNAGTVAKTFLTLINTYNASEDNSANISKLKDMLTADTKVDPNAFYPSGAVFTQAQKDNLRFAPEKIDIVDVSYVSTTQIGLSANVTVSQKENGKESKFTSKYSIVMQKKDSGTWGIYSAENADNPTVGTD